MAESVIKSNINSETNKNNVTNASNPNSVITAPSIREEYQNALAGNGTNGSYIPEQPKPWGSSFGSSNNSIAENTANMNENNIQRVPNYYANYSDGLAGYGSNVTDKEMRSANNQRALANYNAQNLRDQLADRFEYYDQSNDNHRNFLKAQKVQMGMASSANRYEDQRNLLNGIFSTRDKMASGLNGSGAWNLLNLANDRNDYFNNTRSSELRQNLDSAWNNYNQAVNSNQLAKIDAQIGAKKSLADLEANLAADLNNINPDLFELPGENSSINLLGRNSHGAPESSMSQEYADSAGYSTSGYGQNAIEGADPLTLNVRMNQPSWEPYLYNDNQRAKISNQQLSGNDYFSRLLNGYNGYRS